MADYRPGSRSADQYPQGVPTAAPTPQYNPTYSVPQTPSSTSKALGGNNIDYYTEPSQAVKDMLTARGDTWTVIPKPNSTGVNPVATPQNFTNLNPGNVTPANLPIPDGYILPLEAHQSQNVANINNAANAYYQAVSRGDQAGAQAALSQWNQGRTSTGQAGYTPGAEGSGYQLAMNAYASGLGAHPDTGIMPGSYALANNPGSYAPNQGLADQYMANVASLGSPNPLTAPTGIGYAPSLGTAANPLPQAAQQAAANQQQNLTQTPQTQTPQQNQQLDYQGLVSLLNGLLGGQGGGLVGQMLGQQTNNDQLTQALSALSGFAQIAQLMNPWQNQGLYQRRRYPVTQ
jgi:hypothetical protein